LNTHIEPSDILKYVGEEVHSNRCMPIRACHCTCLGDMLTAHSARTERTRSAQLSAHAARTDSQLFLSQQSLSLARSLALALSLSPALSSLSLSLSLSCSLCLALSASLLSLYPSLTHSINHSPFFFSSSSSACFLFLSIVLRSVAGSKHAYSTIISLWSHRRCLSSTLYCSHDVNLNVLMSGWVRGSGVSERVNG